MNRREMLTSLSAFLAGVALPAKSRRLMPLGTRLAGDILVMRNGQRVWVKDPNAPYGDQEFLRISQKYLRDRTERLKLVRLAQTRSPGSHA